MDKIQASAQIYRRTVLTSADQVDFGAVSDPFRVSRPMVVKDRWALRSQDRAHFGLNRAVAEAVG